MQILPSKELLPYIKHYLFLERDRNRTKKLRLFSDGNTGMVFCMQDKLIYKEEGFDMSTRLPGSFIYGQISEFRDLYLRDKASFIIVVFEPDGIKKLLGISANEIKDKIIGAEDVFGSHGLLLHEKLFDQPDLKERLNLLNGFFLKLNPKYSLPNQLLIQASLDYIIRNRGMVTIKELVKYTGYTERHIERVFNENVGITPKRFGSIIRLHQFLKLMKNKTGLNNITGFCYESGYFDQSHLIKEFKKYTGITPTQYLNDTYRLATNFLEFNPANTFMSDLYNFSK